MIHVEHLAGDGSCFAVFEDDEVLLLLVHDDLCKGELEEGTTNALCGTAKEAALHRPHLLQGESELAHLREYLNPEDVEDAELAPLTNLLTVIFQQTESAPVIDDAIALIRVFECVSLLVQEARYELASLPLRVLGEGKLKPLSCMIGTRGGR